MLCYKDRQWCSFSLPNVGALRCGNTACYRFLTDDESRQADAWARSFGAETAPIDTAPLRNADCGYRTPDDRSE